MYVTWEATVNYATACIATIFFGAVTPVIAAEITPANPETEQHTQIALDQNSIAILPIKVLIDDPRGPGLAVFLWHSVFCSGL